MKPEFEPLIVMEPFINVKRVFTVMDENVCAAVHVAVEESRELSDEKTIPIPSILTLVESTLSQRDWSPPATVDIRILFPCFVTLELSRRSFGSVPTVTLVALIKNLFVQYAFPAVTARIAKAIAIFFTFITPSISIG